MIGRTVSHYKILELLGEGGMGIVYKAEDTRLRRLVALKFLPRMLTVNKEARERFAHEARAASGLDHPNICTIHEIDETTDGQMFIVMAYYEGDSLRQKMNKGALDVSEAVDLVLQVATGLQKAHENDIIHRDIKPANVMVTKDGRAKIVDFGLAKLSGRSKMTRTGKTLGTVEYMSPEQISGSEVNQQTDIWSLGAVLYELVAGQVPFGGDYDQAVAYAIVNEPHETVSKLRPGVLDELDAVINKALAKNTSERFRDMSEFIAELRSVQKKIVSGDAVSHPKGSFQNWMRSNPLVRVVVVVILLLAAGLVYTWWHDRRVERGVLHGEDKPLETGALSQIVLKQVTFSEGLEEYPAFSPDGSQMAYSAEKEGHKHIFIVNLATGDRRQITGEPRDDIQPAWSMDGKTILFVRSNKADGKLELSDVFGRHSRGDIWQYSLESGREVKLVENAFNPSFSPDGESIAFDSDWSKTRRIWVADRLGRNPEQVTSDPSEAVSHILPKWSADGAKIVFQNMDWTKFDIKVLDLKTRVTRWITDDSFQDLNPVWSHSGDKIYFSSYRSGGLNVWGIPVAGDGSPAGPPQPVTTGAGQDVQLEISPDGTKLAFSIQRLNADIWRLPVDSGTGQPAGEPEQVVATTREDSRGAWSPDGNAIVFNSDRGGDMNIWTYSFGDGKTKQLSKGPGGDYQADWSPDGKEIAFFSARAGNPDIWSVDVESGELKQLTDSPSLDINPFYSPDGRHIAYQSDQDGRKEVWVMNADGTDQRRLTSIGVSGHFMRWSPDGQQIIFRSPSIGERGTASWVSRVSPTGAEPQRYLAVMGGSHISFSQRSDLVLDVVGHTALWVTSVVSGDYQKVFQFDNPDVRIDYPVWSPDGRWILFDYVNPGGGDIWIIEGLD